MLANITGDWPYILIAIVILFGGSQLPKLARNAGEAMKEFRKAGEEASKPAGSSGTTTQAATPAMPPAIPIAPQPAQALPQASPAPAQTDERITLTRAELDALLADREARAKAARSADSPQN